MTTKEIEKKLASLDTSSLAKMQEFVCFLLWKAVIKVEKSDYLASVYFLLPENLQVQYLDYLEYLLRNDAQNTNHLDNLDTFQAGFPHLTPQKALEQYLLEIEKDMDSQPDQLIDSEDFIKQQQQRYGYQLV
jgi:hypothetical protein